MPGTNACFRILFYVPLCYIQIQAELDLSSHIYVVPPTSLSFDIKIMAKMRRRPQYVGNVRADVPYMLRFLTHFCYGFISYDNNVARRKRGETHPAQLESTYRTMGQKHVVWRSKIKSEPITNNTTIQH